MIHGEVQQTVYNSGFICFYILGGIELLVFSELFKVELDVINIQTLRIDQFGM